MNITQWLQGKKTYGLTAIGLALVAAVKFHWIAIDPQTFQQLVDAVILAAIAALRSGVSK